jgi:hypothetical protein
VEGRFSGSGIHLGESLEAASSISSPCGQGALRGGTCYGCVSEGTLWREVEGDLLKKRVCYVSSRILVTCSSCMLACLDT